MEKTGKVWGWSHWSSNERAVAVALLTLLAVFVVVWVVVLYEPPTGPGLCGVFGAEPCPGNEALNLISSSVNSSRSLSIQIWNAGSVAVSLSSYVAKSQYSQPYENTNWSGPTVPPNGYSNATLIIDGQAFTFHAGSLYIITLISSRNNQFTFTIQT